MNVKEIFLKPKYSYSSDKVVWYACPKCGHLIVYLAPHCDNCKNKMKWSKE